MSQVAIRNAHAADANDIYALTCQTYGFNPACPGEYAVPPKAIRHQIRRFPEAQLVATVNHCVIGYTLNIRTHRSPDAPALNWVDALGGATLTRHETFGEWLYIADFAVHPEYRGLGIGTQLCQAWFELARQLNVRGIYAGGLLAGYRNYYREISIEQYGQAVRCGELTDPTVTMYMKRGFKIGAIIKNYEGTSIYDHAMLITWENPQYYAPVRQSAAHEFWVNPA